MSPRRWAAGPLALAILVAAGPARGAPPGPPLTVPEARLDAALTCPAGFSSPHEPVLLVHGTGLTAEESWSWNLAETLPALGFDVCLVHLPDRAWGDIQRSAEYVVHAVRTIAGRSGRRVDVVGHSQGGLEPRWAIRFWPDVRDLVDDLVTLASPHHGTFSADGLCATGRCPPAVWQMRHGSRFLAALNAGDPTPGPVSHTSLRSLTDELVQPPATAVLPGASNVLIQDLCPGRPVHHGGMLHDAVAFAVLLDALARPGPADPRRIGPPPCARATMPGVTLVDALAGNAILYSNGLRSLLRAPMARREPPLAAYAS
jgi:triacylglycerol lipase